MRKHNSHSGLRNEVNHFDNELHGAGRKAKSYVKRTEFPCPKCGTRPMGENLGCHHCVKHKFY